MSKSAASAILKRRKEKPRPKRKLDRLKRKRKIPIPTCPSRSRGPSSPGRKMVSSNSGSTVVIAVVAVFCGGSLSYEISSSPLAIYPSKQSHLHHAHYYIYSE